MEQRQQKRQETIKKYNQILVRAHITKKKFQRFLNRGYLKCCRDCFECPFCFIVFLVKKKAISDGV